MRIYVCGSMSFADQMMATKQKLEALGHTVLVSSFVESHLGLSHEESEAQAIKEKHAEDAMKVDFKKLHEVDAMLVLNYDKRGIANYIGGNTLLEMGLGHVLDCKIFLTNPVPEIPYYQSEIEAMHPVIIGDDYSLLV